MNDWILVGCLAVCTYLSRLAGVEFMAGRNLNPKLRLYFGYVPVAILSALLVDQILTPSGGRTVVSVPVLAACLATFAARKFVKSFLPCILIGIAVGLLVRIFFAG